MSEKQENSRYSRRVDVHYSAVFTTPSEAIECTVVQISEGGVLFVSHKPVEVGTNGRFSLSVFSNEPDVVVEAEVIYRLKERESHGTFVYGVRFTGLDSNQKEDIARVIRFSTVRGRYTPKPSNPGGD